MRKLFAVLLSVNLIGLAGCDVFQASAPAPLPEPDPSSDLVAPSDASVKMSRHLARIQANLLVQGLLRTDGGGPDVPFTRRDLVNNFIRVALYDEYVTRGGRLVARETESRLRRWNQPIQMKVEFGASVPPEQRAKDHAKISAYAKRLSRLTRTPIHLTTSGPANYHILILNEDERYAIGPHLTRIAPGISKSAVRTVTDMGPSTLCLVLAFSSGAGSSTYSKAVAVIRAEHPDLLRLSCIHEELTQGLGLANDSQRARPSIFNDDEEFGLLTRHDELLLRILYDRRLHPGMTVREARPIVEKIAAELMGETT